MVASVLQISVFRYTKCVIWNSFIKSIHIIAIAPHYNVLDCRYAITDSVMTDQIIEKVTGDVVDVNEESDIAESHSGSEDLFQRR